MLWRYPPLTLKQLDPIFFKTSFDFLLLFITHFIFLYETVPIQCILFSIVDTDVLVLKHQDISSHSAEYAPMHFQPFISHSHDQLCTYLSFMW